MAASKQQKGPTVRQRKAAGAGAVHFPNLGRLVEAGGVFGVAYQDGQYLLSAIYPVREEGKPPGMVLTYDSIDDALAECEAFAAECVRQMPAKGASPRGKASTKKAGNVAAKKNAGNAAAKNAGNTTAKKAGDAAAKKAGDAAAKKAGNAAARKAGGNAAKKAGGAIVERAGKAAAKGASKAAAKKAGAAPAAKRGRGGV